MSCKWRQNTWKLPSLNVPSTQSQLQHPVFWLQRKDKIFRGNFLSEVASNLTRASKNEQTTCMNLTLHCNFQVCLLFHSFILTAKGGEAIYYIYIIYSIIVQSILWENVNKSFCTRCEKAFLKTMLLTTTLKLQWHSSAIKCNVNSIICLWSSRSVNFMEASWFF